MTTLQRTILEILSHFPEGLTLNELSTILWKIDGNYYRKHGRSLTGATYIKE